MDLACWVKHMINEPVVISRNGFQEAWVDATKSLMSSKWELRNLIVHIQDINQIDMTFHGKMTNFSKELAILNPKQVAYTIFPHNLYMKKRNAASLFDSYNRRNGMYSRIKTGWGTYFRRMSNYEKGDEVVNQLDEIISAINNRTKISKAAYTIVIQKPGGETIKPLGGPCLNYLSVQLDSCNSTILGMLAVYRNHEFLERAYGNYFGLCNLINFYQMRLGLSLDL